MARRSGAIARRKRRRGDGGAIWWAALGVLLILTAAGAAMVVNFLSSRGETDPATLCAKNGPNAVTAILLDLTDPLSPAQAERLQSLVEREVSEAPVNTMISIGVVSRDRKRWGSSFARCKPATGEQASVLYQNPKLITERFRREFRAPLDKVIGETLSGATEDRSPIMESLQALLADTPHALDRDEKLSIVIASDMLQNSDVLSLYRGEGWDHLVASGAAARLARNLDGARVTLIMIPRPQASATARAGIDPFWSRYFDQQGAAAPFHVETLGDL